MNPIKKNPLGRGLESLIPRGEPINAPSDGGEGRLHDIDITDIVSNTQQPRKDFDEEALSALTASIRAKGVLQPIIVIKTDDSRYMLISGERRWRAAGLAGVRKVPAIIMDVDSENEKLELALIENTQRDDLKPLELAWAYRDLMQRCEYRQEDVARIAGKSRSAVANTLRLLDLPSAVAESLESKTITEGHARVFLSIPEMYCMKLLDAVLSRSLSVRQTEALAKQMQQGQVLADQRKTVSIDPDMNALAYEMEKFFESKVTLKARGKNNESGVIEIRYSSQEDLSKIVNKLRGEI